MIIKISLLSNANGIFAEYERQNATKFIPSVSSLILASSSILRKFSVKAIDVGGKSAAVSINSVALASPKALFNKDEWASTSAPRFASNCAASKEAPLFGSFAQQAIVKGVCPILFSRST